LNRDELSGLERVESQSHRQNKTTINETPEGHGAQDASDAERIYNHMGARRTSMFIFVTLAASLSAPVARGQLAEASLSLRVSPNVVTFGQRTELSGRADPAGDLIEDCLGNSRVAIYEDAWDDIAYDWRLIKTVPLDESGRFNTSLTPRRSTSYRAETTADAGVCSGAVSRRRGVKVRFGVTLTPHDASVARGSMVRLRATVQPACQLRESGKRVSLFRLTETRFVKVGATKENENCVAIFRKRLFRRAVFRAYAPYAWSAAVYYFRGWSRPTVVEVQ
jgi:hypothetical protein